MNAKDLARFSKKYQSFNFSIVDFDKQNSLYKFSNLYTFSLIQRERQREMFFK